MAHKSSRTRVIWETLLLAEKGSKEPRQADPALVHCNLASNRRRLEKGVVGEDYSRANPPLLMRPTGSTMDLPGICEGSHLPWFLSVMGNGSPGP